jgi:alpha-tubulin suppressor-like RCC1 family protein
MGSNNACAFLVNGDVWCWGTNQAGDIGCDSPDAGPPGVPITQPRQLVKGTALAVAAGLYTTCALVFQNSTTYLQCVGNNRWGGLANGAAPGVDTICDSSLVKIPPVNVVGLEAADFDLCLATDQGNRMCWGANSSAGNFWPAFQSSKETTPKMLPFSDPLVTFSLGWRHSCVLLSSGVSCWGESLNGKGETGEITPLQGVTQDPRPIALTDPIDVVAHREFSCAIEKSGRVSCWGSNSDGQITSATDNSAHPNPVDIVFP